MTKGSILKHNTKFLGALWYGKNHVHGSLARYEYLIDFYDEEIGKSIHPTYDYCLLMFEIVQLEKSLDFGVDVRMRHSMTTYKLCLMTGNFEMANDCLEVCVELSKNTRSYITFGEVWDAVLDLNFPYDGIDYLIKNGLLERKSGALTYILKLRKLFNHLFSLDIDGYKSEMEQYRKKLFETHELRLSHFDLLVKLIVTLEEVQWDVEANELMSTLAMWTNEHGDIVFLSSYEDEYNSEPMSSLHELGKVDRYMVYKSVLRSFLRVQSDDIIHYFEELLSNQLASEDEVAFIFDFLLKEAVRLNRVVKFVESLLDVVHDKVYDDQSYAYMKGIKESLELWVEENESWYSYRLDDTDSFDDTVYSIIEHCEDMESVIMDQLCAEYSAYGRGRSDVS